MDTTPVYLEAGKKRVFACSLDWPGWCRAARTEELALEALSAYSPRYAIVAKQAGVEFPSTAGDTLHVVERLEGTATTDFGAPGVIPLADAQAVTAAEARRFAALLMASWRVFEDVAAAAPAELRKGPRGGGRDRDKIVAHVLESEISYFRMIGIRHRPPPIDDHAAYTAIRDEVLGVLGAASDGSPLRERGWTQRTAVRRIAWHALDHAWEIEDRSQ